MTFYPSRLLALTTPPDVEPITLAEAKLYLRVDGDAEDTLIADLTAAARVAAEEYLGKSLVEQQWKLAFDEYAGACVALPRGPIISVESVTSYNVDEVATIISDAAYRLNAARDALEFDSVIFGHRVEIIYSAGYGDAAQVPRAIKQGMLAHMAAMFDRREQGGVMPATALALYAPFREVRV